MLFSLAGGDVDGEELTFLARSTAHETLVCTPSRSCSFTPDADFNRLDAVTFTVSDGQTTSAPATVAIAVIPVNDAPTATADKMSTDEDTPWRWRSSGPTSMVTPDPDGHGRARRTDDVLRRGPHLHPGRGLERPRRGQLHRQQRPGGLRPGHGRHHSRLNDAPTATSRAVSTDEDTPMMIALDGSDVDGDVLSTTVTTAPTHGTLSCTRVCTYTPAADWNGPDSVGFTVFGS